MTVDAAVYTCLPMGESNKDNRVTEIEKNRVY